MTSEVTVRMEPERETKTTFRFRELPEGGGEPKLGTLYVPKALLEEIGASTGNIVVTIRSE